MVALIVRDRGFGTVIIDSRTCFEMHNCPVYSQEFLNGEGRSEDTRVLLNSQIQLGFGVGSAPPSPTPSVKLRAVQIRLSELGEHMLRCHQQRCHSVQFALSRTAE